MTAPTSPRQPKATPSTPTSAATEPSPDSETVQGELADLETALRNQADRKDAGRDKPDTPRVLKSIVLLGLLAAIGTSASAQAPPSYVQGVEATLLASGDPDLAELILFTHGDSARVVISDINNVMVSHAIPALGVNDNKFQLDISALAFGMIQAQVTVYGGLYDATSVVQTTATGYKVASDGQLPTVASFVFDGSPAASDSTWKYLITFDEPVRNVSLGDFEIETLAGHGNGVVTSIETVTPILYRVGVAIYGWPDGPTSIRPRLREDSDITDAFGNGDGNGGFVAPASGPWHESTFNRLPEMVNFRLRSEDISPSNPVGLSIGKAKLFIPRLGIVLGDSRLELDVRFNPVPSDSLSFPFQRGGKAAKFYYEARVLVGPEMLAVDLSGLFEVIAGVAGPGSPGSPVLPFGATLQPLSSINFATVNVATTNIGVVNTFLAKFKLNLASNRVDCGLPAAQDSASLPQPAIH